MDGKIVKAHLQNPSINEKLSISYKTKWGVFYCLFVYLSICRYKHTIFARLNLANSNRYLHEKDNMPIMKIMTEIGGIAC